MDNIKQLHEQFRKKESRRAWLARSLQLLLLILFFALWEIASKKEWIDPLLFSSPSSIWDLFLNKWMDGSLWVHIWTTLLETGVGFILGTVLGAIIATFLWWIPLLARVLDPYLVVLNAMPKVALGPIIIVIFGPNISSSIAMGVIISIIITILVIYSAFQEVDSNYIKVMDTFGANKWQCYKQVVLPASFPAIISTLKVNVGLSWVGVIFGELLVSKQGLGYLISYGFQVFNFTLVLLSVLLTCVLATLMYVFVEAFEKLLIGKRKRS
ncbi:ABC transporter permease [Bacillus anthracis]|uniref:ABC transporter permease n=1 Tax=Bacillus TaxID=1386 RepID=UPI0008FEAB04|nr:MULTISPECIES: ABC transporter permease [Bacillus]PEU75780.1 ABC transporter permease [Bacillus anthracis]PFR93595.1 ABC transporter permease [Bacillus cereus]MBG0963199.1 ABC transporter permease [Bacillus sp. SRB1LM]OJE42221.1 ABC transporter permease [Bacillus tropicus]PEZ71280.1 ABC transporter permease [Bacillus anthracis]